MIATFLCFYYLRIRPSRPQRHQRLRESGSGAAAAAAAASAVGEEDVEEAPRELRGREAIVIEGLRKTFRPGPLSRRREVVHAVKGVSLNIYPGEITAILGGCARLIDLLSTVEPA